MSLYEGITIVNFEINSITETEADELRTFFKSEAKKYNPNKIYGEWLRNFDDLLHSESYAPSYEDNEEIQAILKNLGAQYPTLKAAGKIDMSWMTSGGETKIEFKLKNGKLKWKEDFFDEDEEEW